MADVHTRSQRSGNMAAIKGSDTKPEMLVRRLVHGMGYRYRLHARSLPGRPDLVFASRRKVIFVHGCYWHCHDCRWGRVQPATNADFWRSKRAANVARDTRQQAQLRNMGWVALVVWECETRDEGALRGRIVEFLAAAAEQGSLE